MMLVNALGLIAVQTCPNVLPFAALACVCIDCFLALLVSLHLPAEAFSQAQASGQGQALSQALSQAQATNAAQCLPSRSGK
jgi:hypothetical protein